jgi:serine/threonine-protein kinase
MIISKDKNSYDIPNPIIADSHEKYEVMEYIGSGGNAAVYEVIDIDGDVYAVKFLFNLGYKNRRRFKQEIRVLREISHPHLIKCIDEGTVIGKMKGDKTVEIPFMIMEKADTDLKKFLKKKGKLEFSEYISQFCGLSEALSYLNEKVVHRDIKLDNILIVGEKWVLSDLGICTYLSEEEHEDLTEMGEKVGPKYWLSPEAINAMYDSEVEIIPASDVFQLAAVFWFIVNGRYPLGIVENSDWVNSDEKTCNALIEGLAYSADRRPQNGKEFYDRLVEVRQYYEELEVPAMK